MLFGAFHCGSHILDAEGRVSTSATYKDAASYYGFNNRNSQDSWMMATSISSGNIKAATTGSFLFSMIFGTESEFSVYGWCVGRALDRKWDERLSDNDFRKKSWLAPNFFYESTNQRAGEPLLIEKDSKGNLINNKWLVGNNDRVHSKVTGIIITQVLMLIKNNIS